MQLSGKLDRFVEQHRPNSYAVSLARVERLAKFLGLQLDCDDPSQIKLVNKRIRLQSDLSRRAIETAKGVDHSTSCSWLIFAIARLTVVWDTSFDLVKDEVIYTPRLTGYKESGSQAMDIEPMESVENILLAMLSSTVTEQRRSLPEPVIRVWEEPSGLPTGDPDNCLPLGRVDALYFQSEVPENTPSYLLNYLGLPQ